MHHKPTPPKSVSSPSKSKDATSEPVSSSASDSAGESTPYAKVRRLLEAGRLEEALTLARSRQDIAMRNAQGVCLMRMSRADEAVRVYRGFVLDHSGLFLRDQVSAVYKTNFAYALMLSGRLTGGLNILGELADEDHPSVDKLRAAVNAWKAKLSLWQRIGLWLGMDPKTPLVLDSPPGELA